MKETQFGRLWLVHGDIVSTALAEGRHWDPHVYDALAPHLAGVVIEGGANVGALTMRFARVATRVIAFEPHPVFAACLRANMEALGLRAKATILEAGLYSRRVAIAARTTAGSPSSWSWLPVEESTIGQVRADPFLTRAHVTAIKLDVQGADLHAMTGLQTVIQRDHPAIVFEYEDRLSVLHGHTWRDYESQLHAWNYSIERIADTNDFLCEWRP